MYGRYLTLIFSVVLLCVLCSAEFPSDVKRCKSADSDCQKTVLHELVENFAKKGHEKLHLIAFEPLPVKSLHLPKITGSPVNIDLEFKDIKLTGISNVNVHSVSGLKEDGPNKFTYEVDASFPKIELNGPYKVNGQVLILPITGQGKSKIIFDGVDGKIKGKASLVEKKGKKYLNVDKIHMDLKPKKTTFAFENLFNGDAVLGDNMNKFLNENWIEVYTELKPVIMEAIGKILLHITNGVLSTIEYSEVFLPA